MNESSLLFKNFTLTNFLRVIYLKLVNVVIVKYYAFAFFIYVTVVLNKKYT